MSNDFQSEPPRFARTPIRRLDEAPNPFGKPRTGLPAWGWLLIVVAALLFLCGGVGVIGAVGWLLYQEPAQGRGRCQRLNRSQQSGLHHEGICT